METVQRADSGHLLAFDHQVAGQSLVFQYDSGTICKSLIPREHDVYRALPPVLRPFIPEYRGVVDIPLMDHVTVELGQQPSHVTEAVQRHLAKVRRSEEQDDVYHFLLLENLVAGFRQPCILDLKLGTRQHGDDAPVEKVVYQVNKCRNTTSCSMGVRLCGMKVFQITTGDYLTVDKAEGRRMKEQDLERAVDRFLHNGRCVRRDVIPAILQRLRRLKSVIEGLPTFRFYSSSLLIVYDGQADAHSLLPAGLPKPNSTHSSEHSIGRTLRGTSVTEQGWENKLGGRGRQGCVCQCPCLHAASNTQCPLYGAKEACEQPCESGDHGRRCDGGDRDTDIVNGLCARAQCPVVNDDVTGARVKGSHSDVTNPCAPTEHSQVSVTTATAPHVHSTSTTQDAAGTTHDLDPYRSEVSSTYTGRLSTDCADSVSEVDMPAEWSDTMCHVASDTMSKVASEFMSKVASDDMSKVASDDMSKVASDDMSKVASDNMSKVASDTVSKVASDTVSHVEGRVDAECHAEGHVDDECHTEGQVDDECHVEGRVDVECHAEGRVNPKCHAEGRVDDACHAEGRVDPKCRVDVRLVDFAHTTFAGLGGVSVLHSGVDKGCLLGLQTLINIFTHLLQGSK